MGKQNQSLRIFKVKLKIDMAIKEMFKGITISRRYRNLKQLPTQEERTDKYSQMKKKIGSRGRGCTTMTIETNMKRPFTGRCMMMRTRKSWDMHRKEIKLKIIHQLKTSGMCHLVLWNTKETMTSLNLETTENMSQLQFTVPLREIPCRKILTKFSITSMIGIAWILEALSSIIIDQQLRQIRQQLMREEESLFLVASMTGMASKA